MLSESYEWVSRAFWNIRKSPVDPLGSGKMWALGRQTLSQLGSLPLFLQMLLEKRKFKSTKSCFHFGDQRAQNTETAPRNPKHKRSFRTGSGNDGKDVSKINVHYGQPPWCSDAQLLGKRRWWCELPMAVARLKVSARTNTSSVSKLNLCPQSGVFGLVLS